jgi:hypothetical protein
MAKASSRAAQLARQEIVRKNNEKGGSAASMFSKRSKMTKTQRRLMRAREAGMGKESGGRSNFNEVRKEWGKEAGKEAGKEVGKEGGKRGSSLSKESSSKNSSKSSSKSSSHNKKEGSGGRNVVTSTTKSIKRMERLLDAKKARELGELEEAEEEEREKEGAKEGEKEGEMEVEEAGSDGESEEEEDAPTTEKAKKLGQKDKLAQKQENKKEEKRQRNSRESDKIESVRGPPVNLKTMHSDEWQTTLEGWRPMAELLKAEKSERTSSSTESGCSSFTPYKSRSIWQPFFYDGECSKHLQTLGFQKVLHGAEDFFEKIKDAKFMKKVDLIWDNPP